MSFWSKITGFFKNGEYSPYNGYSSVTGNTSPRWVCVDDSRLWELYRNTPHLALVINRKAELASTMVVKHYDSKGEIVENSKAIEFLKNPNVITDWDNFIQNIFVSDDVFSNWFLYKNSSVFKNDLPRALWILPPDLMEVDLTGKSLDQVDKKGVISGYKMTSSGTMFEKRDFEPEEILHSKKNNRADDAIGHSKIKGIQKSVSNINEALTARNILTRERGGIGILSGVNGNSGVVLSDKEKERIDKQLNKKYGLKEGQENKIITQTELKWQPMNFDVKQLQLPEGVRDDFMVICDTFGLPSDIFSLIMNSTYENKRTATVGAYQNTVIPESNAKLKEIADFIGLSAKGETLVADFSHLPIMQESQKEKAESQKAMAEAMEKSWNLVQAEAITKEQFNKMYGID